MKKVQIKGVLKDRHDFLEEYIKSILPKVYYRRSIKKRIKKTGNILEYYPSEEYKKRIKKYWMNITKRTTSLHWHRAYTATNGIEDVHYVPEDIFYKTIEPSLNRYDLAKAYEDKNYSDLLFKGFNMPRTVIRNINGVFYNAEYNQINLNDTMKIIKKMGYKKKLVCKPSIDSGGGKKIEVINLKGFKEEEEIDETIMGVFDELDKDFIIQEYLEQHQMFMDMHKNSLNTIRIISLRLNGEINFLSGIVRMGNNGSNVDNATVGGLTCGFNLEGDLNSFATGHDAYDKYLTHPYSKFEFERTSLPSMKLITNYIKELHSKLLYFDLASWDIAIDKSGYPVLIEVNLKMQDINFHQRNNGPLFGDLTDEVLFEVFGKQKTIQRDFISNKE